MEAISVTIERYVDDHFPGFVQCALSDAHGRVHRFLEKAPVVSARNLCSDSVYPQAGCIACVIQEAWTDERGRQLVRVSTRAPWDIESLAGETGFTVLRQQIVACPV